MRTSHHHQPAPRTRHARLRLVVVVVVVGIGLVATACGRDAAPPVEGIATNDGGVIVKPPDVLSGDTEVVDGVDTAPSLPTSTPSVATPAAADSDPATATDPSETDGPPPAPDAAFTWFDGTPGSIAGLAGQPTVLNFWASTCAPCIAEMPDFEVVYQDLGDNVAFVGMNTADRRDAALRLVDQTGVTYPLADDSASEVFRSFSLFVMPTTVLLTEAGDIGFVWSGVLTEKELRILIDRHIAPGSYEDV